MAENEVELEVIEDYRAGKDRYRAGMTIKVSEQRAKFLTKDAPGCFQEPKPKRGRTAKEDGKETKEVKSPPKNKAVQGPAASK